MNSRPNESTIQRLVEKFEENKKDLTKSDIPRSRSTKVPAIIAKSVPEEPTPRP